MAEEEIELKCTIEPLANTLAIPNVAPKKRAPVATAAIFFTFLTNFAFMFTSHFTRT